MQHANPAHEHLPAHHTPVRLGATNMVEMVFPNQANHYGTLFGGNTSLTVVVSATVEDLCSGTCAAALDSRFEMVAVGADGRPVALATSTPDTPQTATPATTN